MSTDFAWSTTTGEWTERPVERFAIPAKAVVRMLSAIAPNMVLKFEQDPTFPPARMPAGKRLWIVDEIKEWVKNLPPAPPRRTWTPNQRAARARSKAKRNAIARGVQ